MSNALNKHTLNLRTQLANTTAFQAWTGASDANDAIANYIHLYSVDAPTTGAWAVLARSDEWSWQATSRASGIAAGTTKAGTVLAFFEITAEFNEANTVAFQDNVSATLEGMLAINGLHMLIDSIQEMAPPKDSPFPTWRYKDGGERIYAAYFKFARALAT